MGAADDVEGFYGAAGRGVEVRFGIGDYDAGTCGGEGEGEG